ncbi:hypothetical protein M3O96_07375 [Aquiflexum sp. TKW24L]|uniref:hypothetical protein n=1 Tax=Aquiflexum sp. TKW24L TaxID=2942212 RepID=UPI0020BECFE6|nr:hypothetical protein [Aquiflexum sp. TKW24L]MCL6258900.1 hypothetical protein [Aquiflexum sp. TKW24L]
MNKELVQKAQELEQTLHMQLSFAKKESEGLIKVGGVALAGAVVAFVAYRVFGNKKNTKTKKVLETLEKEGLLDQDIRDRITKKNKIGLLGRLGTILLPIAVNFGREQLLNRLNEPKNKSEEDAK